MWPWAAERRKGAGEASRPRPWKAASQHWAKVPDVPCGCWELGVSLELGRAIRDRGGRVGAIDEAVQPRVLQDQDWLGCP